MKPEEILDPENMPEELQWVSEHYRLQPNDPVFLLIAWHWKTVQGSESKLTAVSMELQAALTARAKVLIEAADSIAKVGGQLDESAGGVGGEAGGTREAARKRAFRPGYGRSRHGDGGGTGAGPLRATGRAGLRRQALAAFLIGVIFGGSLLAWLLP
jgi:hypothetical protein